MMVTNLGEQCSLASVWMRDLRNVQVQNDRSRFRRNIERIGQVAAYEISKHLQYTDTAINTPLAPTQCKVLATQPVLATILRAGLPLYHGLLSYYDEADSAFIGAYRKHNADKSFVVDQGYMASPALAGRPLILADPMLATGASMVQALQTLTEYDKPSQIHIVCIVAAPEGIEVLAQHFPGAYLWVAAVDERLNDDKYILPGLGDAGDLCFGEKRQH
ncbi:uracil phosphoribosyltransferase [Nemorincola caseinilytica]|uniref:Uracil phosphoribosyltransferase n=1 Tax=Nemorincola caseinilytica TaxID=2054315 RepID=A0ABP8NHK6_9BACT